MRKVCVFILFVLTLMAQTKSIEAFNTIETNQRDVFSYEILDVMIDSNNLNINGWGVLHDKHHFTGPNSHEYRLLLESHSHKLEYTGSIKNTNLTRIMAYQGRPTCEKGSLNQTKCNYKFENSGFKFAVPLNDLKTGHNYKTSLKIFSKPLNQSYKSDLYYPKDHSIEKIHKDRNIKLVSHYQTMKINSFYHTLIARTEPDLNSSAVKMGDSCSNEYKNRAYFKTNTIFNNLRGIEIYDRLITYFKVNIKDAGCDNLRRRVSEGEHTDTFAYIPSLFVHYSGDSMSINVEQILHKPVISAENQTVVQYSNFNPINYATANDIKDGNITKDIKVIYNDVNTFTPGQYKSCYEVHNSLNQSDSKCIDVDVIKANTFYRYVNKVSIDSFIDKSIVWQQGIYTRTLRRILARKP